MRIARVFPRRTQATPTDELAFIGEPPLLSAPEVDEVHVSCAFTYDRKEAERLAKAWEALGVPVQVGGPAYGKPSGEHIPGMYVKPGIVFTSRGCPNNCWFCRVPKVEGQLREYPIHGGFNVCDDNLLACSDDHVKGVFDMLDGQKERPVFTGGLEAARLKEWHVEGIRKLGVHHMFFAYDTPDDYEPLLAAGRMLQEAGYTFASHAMRAYVLIGTPNDTIEKAEKRLVETLRAGFWPMAMLWKDEDGHENKGWRQFQGLWARNAIIYARMAEGEIKL
jgi:hypothetical protein